MSWLSSVQLARAESQLVDDADAAMLYDGSWTLAADVLAHQGTSHVSSQGGATLRFELSGDFVRLFGTTGPDGGHAQIRMCLEGHAECESGELDEQSKLVQHAQVVFARYGLPAGRHRVEVQVADAPMGTVSVDAIAFGDALRGTHYIDNRSGACSNAGAGDSPAAPWCDFTNVNGETLAPGAQLLLARGGMWTQQLGKLYGEGSATAWIAVDAYGEGPLPVIARSGAATDRGVWLDNPSYWRLSHLEVAHTGAGIVAYFTTKGHVGLRLEQLVTHDNDSVHFRSADAWVPPADLPGMYHGAAIFVTGNVPAAGDAAAISDIEVTDVESFHDADPLDIAGFNPGPGRLNFLSTTLGYRAARNVVVRNASFHDAKGAPNFDNVESLKVLSSSITRMCTVHQDIGTTSLFLWSVRDVTVANCLIGDVPYTSSPDGTGMDLESASSSVRIRNNVFANTPGSGVEIFAVRGADDFQRDHEISGNLFYQNGLAAGQLRVDDTDEGSGEEQVSYQGAWARVADGHQHAGTDAAASLAVKFYGAQIALYGASGPDKGIAKVSLCRVGDGVCQGDVMVDAFRNTAALSSLLWTSPRLELDHYVLTVHVTATGNGLATGTAIDFDSALVTNPAFFRGAPQESSIYFGNATGNPDAMRGSASGNLFFEPGGFRMSDAEDRWELKDNISVAAGSLFDGRIALSGTVIYPDSFGIELYDGDQYRPLSRDAKHARWGDDNAFASAFDLQPPACPSCFLARKWVAPLPGTLAIRGRALKNASGGDGVLLRVTKNRAVVWPVEADWRALAGTDREGVSTQVDELVVQRGDQLRFEVAAGSGNDNTADLTSWAPTVAYTRYEQSGVSVVENDALGVGTNQVDYSAAGWTAQGEVHEAITAGAELRILFVGSQITVHGGGGPDYGLAAFSVCSDTYCLDEAQVDFSVASATPDRVVWASSTLPFGTYVLKMQRTGARPGRISFDYAVVSNNQFFIDDEAQGDGLNQVSYHGGTWMRTGDIHYHEGGASEAFYLVRFRGRQATIVGGRNVDRGIVAVSVCDSAGAACGGETLVDAYAPALQIKQQLWTSPLLEFGEHAIKVRATGTHNAASTSQASIIDFDRATID